MVATSPRHRPEEGFPCTLQCVAGQRRPAHHAPGHLLRKRQLTIDPGTFDRLARQLVESSLLLQCPCEEKLEAELLSVERPEVPEEAERLMARLVTQLLPRWLEDWREPWASRAEEFRLKLALECWEENVPEMDVEGTGLYTAIALELGDLPRANSAMEPLKHRDLRLAFQPAFLDDLTSHGLWSLPAGSDTGATSLPALVQRAAMVAKGDQSVNRTMAVLSGPGPSTVVGMVLCSLSPVGVSSLKVTTTLLNPCSHGGAEGNASLEDRQAASSAETKVAGDAATC
ncbi:unnamed protein product [Cladocopium goreaui]|uniref:Uncharacterized protein n=1 Tax=Cladocopium goreaui TaxID=2562237 RepID=A0A9P1C0X2_9DINO|nr:unnamed protein product [Cladocopium goreaui]